MKKQLKTMEDYLWSKDGRFVRVRWFRKDYHRISKAPLFTLQVLDTGTGNVDLFNPGKYTAIGLGTTYLWGLIGFWIIL